MCYDTEPRWRRRVLLPTSTWPGWICDGGPLSLACAIIRQVGCSASFWIFGIGYLMAGLRCDKRALHDLIAGTRVERLF